MTSGNSRLCGAAFWAGHEIFEELFQKALRVSG